jgi:hypothetical protein
MLLSSPALGSWLSAKLSAAGGLYVPYELVFHQNPTYLHAVATGRNSKENVAGYVEEVIRECTARNCRTVLIEERLEGPRLGTLAVFDLISKGANRLRAAVDTVAYVDVNRRGDLMLFAETVAVNRSFPMKVFSTVADAKNWLLQSGKTEPCR